MYVLLAVCCPAVFSYHAFAQRVTFMAEANATRIGVDDQVQVTFKITDVPNLVSLTPGGFSGFEVVSGPFQQQSSSLSMSGNQRYQSSTTSLTYILRPRNVGRFTFPVAVAKDAAGKSYQSNTLRIEVVPGSVMMPGNPRRDPQQGRRPGGTPQQPLPQPNPRQQRTRPTNLPAGSWGLNPGNGGMQQQAAPAGKSVSASDIFLCAVPDKTTAYAGEEVMVRYKIFTRVPMEMGIGRPVAQPGCWTEDADPGKQPTNGTSETVNGRPYSSFILKQTALYPQQEGPLALAAAEAEGIVYIPLPGADLRSPAFEDPLFADDPFLSQGGMAALLRGADPFGSLGVQSGWDRRPVRLSSGPATIRIVPLPEAGKPAAFSGAVGTFEASARLSAYQIAAGQPATLTLTISGQGNLKTATTPVLNLPPGVQAYEPVVVDSIVRTAGGLRAIRQITYTLSADTPGIYMLPDIHFSYFNPQATAYRDAVAPLQARLTVTPATSPAVAASSTSVAKGMGKPTMWLLAAAPMLAAVAYAGVRRTRLRNNAAATTTTKTKAPPAHRLVGAHLQQARALAGTGDAEGCLAAIGQACWGYLSRKLDLPTAALSRNAIAERLPARGVSVETANRLAALLDAVQMARYAPASATGNATLAAVCSEAEATIQKLETEITG